MSISIMTIGSDSLVEGDREAAPDDSECVGSRPAEDEDGIEKLSTPFIDWRPHDEADAVR